MNVKFTQYIIVILLSMIIASLSAIAEPSRFKVTVSNVAKANTKFAVNPSPLAQGVWVVHTKDDILFKQGHPAPHNGIIPLAEDGSARKVAASIKAYPGVKQVKAFAPKMIDSGESYSFTFEAERGDRLSFAIMLVQSNDKFYAPKGEGIELFRRKTPIKGDVTKQIYLWDVGSEYDEKPGIGENQLLRQRRPNRGDAQEGAVILVKSGTSPSNDGYPYPAVKNQIKIVIE